MAKSTGHIGQRPGHGWHLGVPYVNPERPRVWHRAKISECLFSNGWVDRIGMPHGRHGDKLARKAFKGTIGVRHRGAFFAWASSKAANRQRKPRSMR